MKAREQCNKILEEIHALGFTNAITEGKLVNIIMNKQDVIGDRAIQNWTRALIAFGYIEEKAPHVYKINNGQA